MEVHSAPAVAKRMWSYLCAVFLALRKGKRKLLLTMHLAIRLKRRNKAIARSVANLLSHHHAGGTHALRRREYEFSCSNSPAPAGGNSSSFSYFDGATPSAAMQMIEYYAASSSSAPSSPGLLLLLQQDLAPGDECTPAQSPLMPSANDGFSVRVSNYSSEEYDGGGGEAVDDEAEEFIRRFYEQLRRQNQVALLPYLPQESAA